VTIKPDIQWFSHPGGGATDDALVGTLRCVIAF
jgi:carbohydrate-selective porin OprB